MKLLVRMLAVFVPIVAGPALADDDPAYDRFFLTPNVSTLGAGIEAGYRMSESWQFRAGINGLAGRFVYEDRDSDLHSRYRLFSGGLTADYFPFENDFYLSGGLRLSANRVEGTVKNMHGRLKNGSKIFVADPLTDFTVSQNAIQPYIGAGYSMRLREKVSLNFNLGLLYAGTPDLDVDSRAKRLGFTGKQIRHEIERARDRIAPYSIYPVAQVGLKFDF